VEAKKRIILFASGGGSNAAIIMAHAALHYTYEVAALVCNKSDAGAVEKAHHYNVPVIIINKDKFYDPQFINTLQVYKASLLILAGFLWLVPQYLIEAYPNRILNIHPSLLPKYGGKGMYGMHVHRAVQAGKETESGISIHVVNEEYDDGAIIMQQKIALTAADDAEAIAKKVLVLEHTYYKQAIEQYLATMA
jgi:phosphoribosylglycinamide formyltransferase 1